ncbi:MAG: hypothetical protein ABIP27_12190 [Flavobacterium circumlabens]|uniref:hypothetical protein n=1 Tax=Flavobacterium circumlabens TaxID=2133765 RepID=UPI0032665469
MFDLEILDKILSILSKTESNKLTEHEIGVYLRLDLISSLYINDFIIEKNLERLLEDNYIKEVTEDSHIEGFGTHPITRYLLTTHGYTFVKESGYISTYYFKLSIEKENRLLRKSQIELNRSTLSTNRNMSWLTFVIAVGTFIAGIYYLIQIYTFFYS